MVTQKVSIDWKAFRDRLAMSLGDPVKLHNTSPLFYTASPLEILVATVITQATSDRNALRAWLGFQSMFPSWEKVLTQDETLLVEILRPAGLGNQKAKQIRGILAAIYEKLGEFSLGKIGTDADDIWNFLTSLPGVGPKTAACTMLFGLDIPIFPVDTHIQRIAIRTGWVKPATRPENTQKLLSKIIPSALHQDMHILLLNLGRKYCRPQSPRCDEGCPAAPDCRRVSISD